MLPQAPGLWATVPAPDLATLLEQVAPLRRENAVLAPVVGEAQIAVQQEDVVNMDETGWRQEQQRAWLWTAVTAVLTVFRIHYTRSGAAVEARLGPLVRRG